MDDTELYEDYEPQEDRNEKHVSEPQGENKEADNDQQADREEASESSTDDEDDVNIVLAPTFYPDEANVVDSTRGTGGTVAIGGTTNSRQWQRAGFTSATPNSTAGAYGRGGIDLSLVPKPPADFPGANIEYSVFESEIDSLEEKPWRERGAEHSDYFNYGFTEETWREYCRRQQMMRLYAQSLVPIRTVDPGQTEESINEPIQKAQRSHTKRFPQSSYHMQGRNSSESALRHIGERQVEPLGGFSKSDKTDQDDVVLTLTKPSVESQR
eukprot:jgi/Galph1/2229/GphlegSOOS_G898.1